MMEKSNQARVKGLETIKHQRTLYLQGIYQENRHLIRILENNKNTAKIALAILHLAEGGKQGGHFMFGNSDSLVISLFLRLIRSCYEIDESKFRCTVQCRADQNVKELEQYWQNVTKIPMQQFYKVQIDPRTRGKKSIRQDYKGVCRIDYLSADIYNKLTINNKIICQVEGL